MCPYMQAIKSGHMEVFLRLFPIRGCGIEANITGLPLSMAAANGHGEIVDFLILNGADVYRNHDHRYQDTRIGTCPTPLYAASANGHYAVVKQILAAGAGVDVISPRDLVMPSDGAGSEGSKHCSSLYAFAKKVRSFRVHFSFQSIFRSVWKHAFGAFVRKFQKFLDFLMNCKT
jgi:hypothetical protein